MIKVEAKFTSRPITKKKFSELVFKYNYNKPAPTKEEYERLLVTVEKYFKLKEKKK